MKELVFLLTDFAIYLSIETKTCFLEGLFIVMWTLDLTLIELLMISLISAIFFANVVRKIFLI